MKELRELTVNSINNLNDQIKSLTCLMSADIKMTQHLQGYRRTARKIGLISIAQLWNQV